MWRAIKTHFCLFFDVSGGGGGLAGMDEKVTFSQARVRNLRPGPETSMLRERIPSMHVFYLSFFIFLFISVRKIMAA
jgi:hypothetical protein